MIETGEHRTENPDENRSYWESFYRQVSINNESTFCTLVRGKVPANATIVDVGCGSGRDSFAFASSAHAVIGVDRSETAIANNQTRSRELGFSSDQLSFQMIDFSEEQALDHFLRGLRSNGMRDAVPIVYYLRFLLHAIDETTQNMLLQTLANNSVSNDLWALEFRTTEDAVRQKIYDNHYRRFIDSIELKSTIERNFGMECFMHEEGTGFSVYKEEDPYLCRLILRKS